MDLDLLADARWTTSASPRFRARQVWAWAARGASGYEEMTEPAARRCARALAERACRSRSLRVERGRRARRHGQGAVPHRRRPAGGGGADALPRRPPLAVRLLAVGLPADVHVLRDRRDEVRPQPDRARRSSTRRCTSAASSAVDHCVFMGMGEPMMNLDAVLAACERLPDVGITHRRTTISTVGWMPGIDALAEQRRCRCGWRFSLHAAEDALRSRDHAGQRALPARATCSRRAALLRAPSAARCSSST